jgi:alpha-1,4-digalacturonate transport system substrate-binding protein
MKETKGLFVMRKGLLVFLLLALVLSVMPTLAQDAVELRFVWYDDGEESTVIRDLLDRFEAENPDITVVLDVVPYNTTLEQLPLQVEAGEAPDLARITTTPTMAGYYLDLRPLLTDPAYFEAQFNPAALAAMRGPDDPEDGLFGFPNQFTVTGPYISRTLFEQAGIEVPSDSGDPVSWEEWTEVSAQVAAATGTPYAIAIDRTGHRFAGPAISMGADFFDDAGNIVIDSEGFRAYAEILRGWHTNELTPREVWLGSGDSYAQAGDFFVNGQLVFYMSGSWNIGRFANDIGDAFDWDVVPNPTGEGGSTGVPGGSSIVAYRSTAHPQAVARLMEYLVQADVTAEFAARTLFLPGHAEVAAAGVDFETDLEQAASSLNGFLAEVPKLDPQTFDLVYSSAPRVVYSETANRLTQWMLDELTLDEAITLIQAAVDTAIAQGTG